MLTPMDDTLWHQLPTTFDHVGTSDPRFFDRFWFALYAPDGSGAVQFTMGAYRNMNVLDAAVVALSGNQQFNVRTSQSLGSSFTNSCGPLKVDIIEPLKRFTLTVDTPGHVSGSIEWAAVAPPHEEHPHFKRHRGRVTEEYQRFNQIGRAKGWLDLGSQRMSIDDWWACRDHSWGVRPRMGVREPVTGKAASLEEHGFTMAFLFFSTDVLAGHLLLMHREGETQYTNGVVTERLTGRERTIANIDLDVSLHQGTRRFREVTVTAKLDDGEELTVNCLASGPAIAMQGLGYSGGFNDRKGLGVWRGDKHLECDLWHVGSPDRITYPDGRSNSHWHRIQPVLVSCGISKERSEGQGSMTLVLSGSIPRLGLN